MAFSTGARPRVLTRPVSRLPSALARPPVQIFRLVFIPIRPALGSRRSLMLNRISLCKCSYWQARETIRPSGDPTPGSPQISPHSLASPEGTRAGSLSQGSGPGCCTIAPGVGAGGGSVCGASLAGRDRRLFGDEDSGPGLVRRGRARSSPLPEDEQDRVP
jgi:hypothetical protein